VQTLDWLNQRIDTLEVRLASAERERDSARMAIREIFAGLQAWLTEHNLSAQAREREHTSPLHK
jgi:hypothetical protein